jgi:hypothetical protein
LSTNFIEVNEFNLTLYHNQALTSSKPRAITVFFSKIRVFGSLTLGDSVVE